jgi:hypothetical protein
MINPRLLLTNFGVGVFVFAAFSSSGSYDLKSYSVGPAGTNSSSSSTYKLQGSAGEQANGSSSSATRTGGNGSIQTEQLNIPSAPTLGNGSGTYYNKLQFTVNTSGNPADTTYAVAVTTDPAFLTGVKYVQADGTLGASAVYQSYITWGGAGGSVMTGLSPGTTYYVKAAAKEGMFTNTELSVTASSLATVSPSITFSVSPNSLTLSNLLPGSVITSSNVSFALTTNGLSGGGVYVSGLNTGLHSTLSSHTLAAFSGNLSLQPEGFGVQATNPAQSSGGPLSTVSPFNGSGNTVGAESTTPQAMLSTTNPIVSGTANTNLQAKAAATTPASADYTETLTFIAAANF